MIVYPTHLSAAHNRRFLVTLPESNYRRFADLARRVAHATHAELIRRDLESLGNSSPWSENLFAIRLLEAAREENLIETQ